MKSAPLLVAALLALPAQAARTGAPPLELSGDDFPVILQPVVDGSGGDQGGCLGVRARRIDEIALPWRKAVERLHLDCHTLDEDSAGVAMIALAGTAYLKPGAATMAGHPVAEVRLMDSELWGDHQYVLEAAYAAVADDLRRLIETRCLQRRLREESGPAQDCRMTVNPDSLYLEINEISGIWVHADPDDPRRTVYAEAWAD
ncbi:hypothetical protein [Pseudoxanthomonas mexicana]|uniref:hypothetical protein n=1 Tax=Pseudoxanthomonas mexicana TaxID=128785 RepID=UPI00398B56B7